MFVSTKWLNDFIDLSGIDPLDLAEKMSRSGIEIEGVQKFDADLSGLVVGLVEDCVDHENSDHLHVTQVNIGTGELLQIVCGAPNVKTGEKVIVATVGAVLPGGFKIKKSKLRGVESQGMLCSLQELGFKENVIPKKYANGLFLLPQDAPIGMDVIEYLSLDDAVLELSITPNRADALSMRGAAYEVSAVVDRPLDLPMIKENSLSETSELLEAVTVSVESAEIAPRYQLRVIKNVEIKESPIWLQMRLMKAGIRPLNNVVDVTNYVLLQYGQPMHAFDYETLPSKDIKVAFAKDGELFTTLDEAERKLTNEDVMIKSGDLSIALAGVMGGLDSEVTDKTRTVLLETAVFNRQNVRKTANKFNLRSESSARFEKGINLSTIDEAGNWAAYLIAELSGGQVEAGLKEFNQLTIPQTEITLAYESIARRLGIEVSQDELQAIMNRLGFDVTFSETNFTVKVPARRWDITIEADIMEEIARIYGYDRIPTTLPTVPSTPGKLSAKQKLMRQSRQILEATGLNQVISYVLTSEKEATLIPSDKPLVKLALPMSEERSVLRQSMFSSLIEIAKYNQARQNKSLAFYEIGKVFFGQETTAQPEEIEKLAFLVSGQKVEKAWNEVNENYDFYAIKGIVEHYFQSLRLAEKVTYQPLQSLAVMHPGRTAQVLLDGQVIGFFGQVHPNVAKAYDLSPDTFFAEIDFAAVLAFKRELPTQTPIPKYPSTSRDLALLVPKTITHAQLLKTIEEHGGADLISVHLFDRFLDAKIGEDNQSLAYRLVFQDPGKTLVDEDVVKAMNKVTEALKAIPGLEIR